MIACVVRFYQTCFFRMQPILGVRLAQSRRVLSFLHLRIIEHSPKVYLLRCIFDDHIVVLPNYLLCCFVLYLITSDVFLVLIHPVIIVGLSTSVQGKLVWTSISDTYVPTNEGSLTTTSMCLNTLRFLSTDWVQRFVYFILYSVNALALLIETSWGLTPVVVIRVDC